MVWQQDAQSDALVILYHISPWGIHWDIFIGLAGAPDLLTWRCPIDPASWFWAAGQYDGIVIRLPNHRPEYLDYCGPISNDRGWVVPIFQRSATARRHTADEIEIFVPDLSASWTMHLKHVEGQRWRLSVQKVP